MGMKEYKLNSSIRGNSHVREYYKTDGSAIGHWPEVVNVTISMDNVTASVQITYIDRYNAQQTTTFINDGTVKTVLAQVGSTFTWTSAKKPDEDANVHAYTTAYNNAVGGSFTVPVNDYALTVVQVRKTYTISFSCDGKAGTGDYASWGAATCTAEYGDSISRSGNTVTDAKWDAANYTGNSKYRFINTLTANTTTDQYTYSATASGNNITKVTANGSFSGTSSITERTYAILFNTTVAAGYADNTGFNWQVNGTTQSSYTVPYSTKWTINPATSSSKATITLSHTNWVNDVIISMSYNKNYHVRDHGFTKQNGGTTLDGNNVIGTGITFLATCTDRLAVYTLAVDSSKGWTNTEGSWLNSSNSTITTVSYGDTIKYKYKPLDWYCMYDGSTRYYRESSLWYYVPGTGTMTVNTDNFSFDQLFADGTATHKASNSIVKVNYYITSNTTHASSIIWWKSLSAGDVIGSTNPIQLGSTAYYQIIPDVGYGPKVDGPVAGTSLAVNSTNFTIVENGNPGIIRHNFEARTANTYTLVGLSNTSVTWKNSDGTSNIATATYDSTIKLYSINPNEHYEFYKNSVRYYHGSAYTPNTSLTLDIDNFTLSSDYTNGTATYKYYPSVASISYTLSGYSANGNVTWSPASQTWGNSSTYTITANQHYNIPSTSTGSKTLNASNFSYNSAQNDASKTLGLAAALGACTPKQYKVSGGVAEGYDDEILSIVWYKDSARTQATSSYPADYSPDASGNTVNVYYTLTPYPGYGPLQQSYAELKAANFTITDGSGTGTDANAGTAVSKLALTVSPNNYTVSTQPHSSWANATVYWFKEGQQSPIGTSSVPYGSKLHYTLKPNSGYCFTVGNTTYRSTDTYTSGDIYLTTGNFSLTADYTDGSAYLRNPLTVYREVTYTLPSIRTGLEWDNTDQATTSGGSVSPSAAGNIYLYQSTSNTAPTSFSTSTWHLITNDRPTGKAIGNYYLWAYVYVADTNTYANAAGKTINTIISLGTCTFAKHTISLTWGTHEWDWDGTQKTVSAPTVGNKVSGYDCTVSVSNNTRTNAGTQTVTTSISSGSSYYRLPSASTCTLTINTVAISYTAPTALTPTYTGSAQALCTTGSATGGTIYYGTGTASSGPNTWSATRPTATDCGTDYYVWYKIDADSNHHGSISSTYVGNKSYIAKAASKLPTSWEGDAQYYHNKACLTVSGYSGGTIYYRTSTTSSSSGYGSWTTTVPSRTAVGTTWVQCYVKGDSNHSDSTVSSAVSLTVYAATDAMIRVTINDNVYNGQNQVIAELDSSHGIASYTLGIGTDSTNVNNVTWEAANTAISRKTVGTYYIWDKFIPDSSHSNTNNGTYVGKAEISTKSITATITPSANSFVYGTTPPTYTTGTEGLISGHLASISVSGKPTSSSNVGTYTVTATIINIEDENIMYVMDQYSCNNGTCTVTVTKANSTIATAPTLLVPTYNGSAQYLCTEGTANGGAIQYATSSSSSTTPTNWSNSRPTATNCGTDYAVWYRIIGDSNHNDKAAVCIGTTYINKATASFTLSKLSDAMYTGDTYDTSQVITSTTPSVATSSAITASTTTGTSSIDNWVVTAGSMSTANDTDQSITITFTNPGNANYTAGTATFTLAVKKKQYTSLSFNNNTTSVTYGSTLSVAATASPSAIISYSTTKNYTSISSSTLTGTAYSGTNKDTITAIANRTETYAQKSITRQVSVTKRLLTVTADNKSTTYGTAAPSYTISYSGWASGESTGNLTTLPSCSCSYDTTVVANRKAGTYTITPSGAAATNYSFNYVNGTLTVGKAALTATADNKSITYGANAPTYTVSYSGWKYSDTIENLSSQASAACNGYNKTDATKRGVGTYTITCSGAESTNYSITHNTGTLTVNKATLTCTGSSHTVTYGDAKPSVYVIYSGWKYSGEDAGSLREEPTAATTYTSSTAVASSPVAVTVSGGTDNNYTFSYSNGAITINKATISSIAAPTAKNPTYNGSSQQIINNGATGNGTYSYSNHNQTNWKNGGYSVSWSFTADANHVIGSGVTSSGTVTANISKRATTISITPSAASFTYGSTAPTYTYSMSNAHKTGLTLTASASGAPTSSSNVDIYLVTATGATIKDGSTDITSNYSISYGNCNVTVTKANPSYTAPTLVSGTLTYNGSAQTIVNAGSTSHGTITYSIDGGSYGSTRTATTAGDHTVSWKLKGDDNHNDVAATSLGSKNIGVRTVTFTAPTIASGWEWDNENHNTSSGGSVSTGGVLYYYQSTSSTTPTWGASGWTTTRPSAREVGTYYLWYYIYVSDTSNNTGTNINKVLSVGNVTISKRTITLTWQTTRTWTYDGNEKTIAVPTIGNTLGAQSCAVTVSNNKRTNVGEQTVTTSISDGADYYRLPSSSTTTLKINARALTITAPSAKTLTYTGSAQALVNAGSWSNNVSGESGATVGTFKYKLSSDTSYSTSIPTATSAQNGTAYTVNWTFTPGSNYSASTTSGNVSVTISKATPTFTKTDASVKYPNTASGKVTASVAGTAYYGTSTSAMTSTLALSANTATTIVSRTSSSNVGTSTVYARFVPTDTTNYNSVGSSSSGYLTINATTIKGDGNISYSPAAQSCIYSTSSQTITCTAATSTTGTVSYELVSVTKSGTAVSGFSLSERTLTVPASQTAGSYSVSIKATAAEATNYNSTNTTKNFTLTINKATPTLTIAGAGSYVYNTNARSLTVSVSPSINGTVHYGSDSQVSSTVAYSAGVSIGSITNVGSLTRYANFEPSDSTNYNNSSIVGPSTITITQANGTITYSPADKSCIYNTSSQTVSCTAASGNTGTLSYTLDSVKQGSTSISGFSLSGTTLTVPASRTTGSYTVTITATSAATTNYKKATKQASFTLTINKADGKATPSSASTTITSNNSSTVAFPTQSNTLTYTGSSQSPTWTYNSTYCNAPSGGTGSATNAGTYSRTASLKNVAYFAEKSTTITVSVYESATVTASSSDTSVATVSVSGTTVTITGKKAGSATITVNAAATTNYKTASDTVSVTVENGRYAWTNGSLSDQTVNWSIGKATPTVTISGGGSYAYNGSARHLTVTVSPEGAGIVHYGSDDLVSSQVTYSSGVSIGNVTNAGSSITRYVHFEPTDSTNFNWAPMVGPTTVSIVKADGKCTPSTSSKSYTSSDSPSVTLPAQDTTDHSLTYNGSSQSPTWLYNSTYCNAPSGGTSSATAAGTYSQTASLKNVAYFSGSSSTFTVSVYENATVTASSNNTSVATVSVGSTSSNSATVTVTYVAAGSATISLSSAATSNYKAASGSVSVSVANGKYIWSDGTTANKTVSWVINKRATTITGNSGGGVYKGSAYSASGATASNLVSGHTLSSVTGSTSRTAVGTSYYTPSAAVIKDASSNTVTTNYDITYSSNSGYVTVTAKAITIKGNTNSKEYDGSALSVSGGYVDSSTPLVSGHTLTSVSGSASQTNVGNTKYTPSSATIKDASNNTVTSNYSITYTSNSGQSTITARTLTVTGNSNSTVYDGSAHTVSGCTANRLVSGHTITCSGSASQTNVGSNSFTPSSIVIKNSGGTAVTSNYNVTTINNGTQTITARPLTVTAPTAKTSLVYSGSAQALVNAGSYTGQVSGETGGTFYYKLSTSSSYDTSIPTRTNAGTYTVDWKFTAGSNYSGNTMGAVNVTIAKADQTWTLSVGKTAITSGGSTTYSTSGTTVGTVSASVNPTTYASLSDTTITASGDPKGATTTLSVTYPGNDNYNSRTQTKVITLYSKCVAPSQSGTLTYNGSSQTASFGTATYCSVTSGNTGTNAGSYTATFTTTDSSKYRFANEATTGTSSWTIGKRNTTVTAADKSKNYGEANPTFTASATNLVSSSDLGTLGGSCSATASSVPGTYTITPTYTANSNYNVTTQNGTLTIYWKMIVTMNNYVTKFRYKIDSGSWSSDISTNPYTITGIPKASKVTIEGRANENNAAYNYGSYTYGGSTRTNNVYGNGAMTGNITDATISCTRTRKSYTVTLATSPSGYGNWKLNSTSGTTVTSRTIYYGDALTANENVVTCTQWDGGTRWTVYAVPATTTAQYTYALDSISGGTWTGVYENITTTANYTRTLRSYNVTISKGTTPAAIASGTYKVDSGSAQTINWGTAFSVNYGSYVKNVTATAATRSPDIDSIADPYVVQASGDHTGTQIYVRNEANRSVTIYYGTSSGATTSNVTLNSGAHTTVTVSSPGTTYYFFARVVRTNYSISGYSPSAASGSTGTQITGTTTITVNGSSSTTNIDSGVKSCTPVASPVNIRVLGLYANEGYYDTLYEDTIEMPYGSTQVSWDVPLDSYISYSTAQYSYSNSTLDPSYTEGPITTDMQVVITYATRTLRSYNITVRAVYGGSVVTSQTVSKNYGSSISSTTYYGTTANIGGYYYSGGSGTSISSVTGTGTVTTTYTSKTARSYTLNQGSHTNCTFSSTTGTYNSAKTLTFTPATNYNYPITYSVGTSSGSKNLKGDTIVRNSNSGTYTMTGTYYSPVYVNCKATGFYSTVTIHVYLYEDGTMANLVTDFSYTKSIESQLLYSPDGIWNVNDATDRARDESGFAAFVYSDYDVNFVTSKIKLNNGSEVSQLSEFVTDGDVIVVKFGANMGE